MADATDAHDRSDQRIRALNTRIDELQRQLNDQPLRLGVRVLAGAALGLLAVIWLAPDVQGDDVFQGVLTHAFHTGFGVLLAHWQEGQASAALIARVALLAYLLAGLLLVALPPGRLIHPILAAVGALATVLIMVSKPAPFGGEDGPDLVYRWTIAPYAAVGVWVVLIVVGIAMRGPRRG